MANLNQQWYITFSIFLAKLCQTLLNGETKTNIWTIAWATKFLINKCCSNTYYLKFDLHVKGKKKNNIDQNVNTQSTSLFGMKWKITCQAETYITFATLTERSFLTSFSSTYFVILCLPQEIYRHQVWEKCQDSIWESYSSYW